MAHQNTTLHEPLLNESCSSPTPIPVKKNQGSITSSVFTLANSAVGSGILAYPFAFAHMGWLLGIITCLSLAFVMGASMVVISAATARFVGLRKIERMSICNVDDADAEDVGGDGLVIDHDLDNYHMNQQLRVPGNNANGDEQNGDEEEETVAFQDLCGALLGPTGKTLVEVTMLIYLFGACASYLIVIGDMLMPVLEQIFAGQNIPRQLVIAVVGSVTVLPLSMLPSMTAFKYSSILAICSIGYLTVLLTIKGIDKWDENIKSFPAVEWAFFDLSKGPLVALSIVCFSLQCHIQTPPVYSELSDASVGKMGKISVIAYTLCMMLYIPAGIFGTLACGPEKAMISGDVITCFAHDKSVEMLVARVCIAIAAMCAYPLNAFPARFAVQSLLKSLDISASSVTDELMHQNDNNDNMNSIQINNEENQEANGNDDDISVDLLSVPAQNCSSCLASFTVRHSFTWFIAALCVALSVEDLSKVLGLLGSTVAVVIIFFVPATMLLTRDGEGERSCMAVVLACVIGSVGLVTMIAGAATTIIG